MSTTLTKPNTPTTMAAPTALKKTGPPVPPRPQHTLPASSLLKAQRESSKRQATTSSVANTKVTVATATATATEEQQPVLQRKASEVVGNSVGGFAGRTIVYKSPATNLEGRPNGLGTNLNRTMSAPKPPLKLRKAPDVPAPKPTVTTTTTTTRTTTATTKLESQQNANTIELRSQNDNIVIVQSSTNGTGVVGAAAGVGIGIGVGSGSGVTLSRHSSMNIPKPLGLKDPRLSLDRSEFERNSPVNLDMLKPAQPLPRPRKIVNVPVATLDVEEEDSNGMKPPAAPQSHTTNSIFRRSKTTLDSLASRANITTISTVSSASNSFLGGKTVEIKNNLKNAAERLFSEIIVNQQKQQAIEPAKIITKHERAIQHQALLEQELSHEHEKRLQEHHHQQQQQQQQREKSSHQQCLITGQKVTVVTAQSKTTTPTKGPSTTGSNYTRININTELQCSEEAKETSQGNDVTLGRTEKKIAFHEMLISELAAMRSKSSSMEQLSARSETRRSPFAEKTATATKPTTQNITTTTKTTTTAAAKTVSTATPESPQRQIKPVKNADDVDLEDVDADNVEDDDVEGDCDDDDFSKRLRVGANQTTRRRCPSGCSSDSSPYGTERSSRIRTADWIEVSDNGKKVNMSSCHISLEDSGLEDEERLDEMSSSGVGDSWDSVKEVENEKRSRSAQRAMSIPDLPPLPKSLSGFNKMLGSDSGLLSDNETKADNNSNNKADSVKDSNSMNINNNNKTDDNTNDRSNNNNNNINKSNNKSNNNDSGIDNTPADEAKESCDENEPPVIAAASKTTLDIQLATLKKEMFGLRQLDLSLLSQLWALNDSIQEFRTILQDQDQDSYSPHSPTPSSYDSVSSDGEDVIISNKMKTEQQQKPKIITTQPKLLKSHSTEASNMDSSSPAAITNSPRTKSRSASSIVGQQQQRYEKSPAPLPKAHMMVPVPRMRTAPPPPPPTKSATPPRPT